MRLCAILLVGAVACGPGGGAPAAPTSPPRFPTTAPSTFPPAPFFTGTVRPLTEAERATMTGVSWHEGCPVPLDDLSALEVTFWGFDGRDHDDGLLVVHEDAADALLDVFGELFRARYPFERIEPVDAYGGDDNRSMEANNTSAFNCRLATGSDSSWSEHAFGRAIDVNPIQNPWVPQSGPILPPAGEEYADRSNERPGMILAGGDVVELFASIGWSWGGDWTSVKDYQHFSATGR
ncbi:MAG: M15 family metallopeptidase [Actinomycetota bacterium]